MTKERPLLCAGDVVRAILEGRKKHTRRVVNFGPYDVDWCHVVDTDTITKIKWNAKSIKRRIECKYGEVGDRLWVREAFAVQPDLWAKSHGPQPLHYLADCTCDQIEDYTGKPSIHMPRWASRITLEITDVKVERLQDISEEDATLEGVELHEEVDFNWKDYGKQNRQYACVTSPVESFRTLWDSIYAQDHVKCWSANPWVWAIEFKKVEHHD